MEFDVVSYMMGAAAGGAGSVPLIPESVWSQMTVAQKNEYGLVAVQTADAGVIRGYVADGASYMEDPALIYWAAMNGASTTPLEYTAASDNRVAVLVAAVNVGEGKDISNIKISHNAVDITADFPLRVSVANRVPIYGAILNLAEGDTLTVENTQNVQNTGVQLFILTNVNPADVSEVGLANNDNTTFTIPQSDTAWYVQVAMFGYYQTGSTTPTVTLFQCLDSAGTSTPCPNTMTYWYGGTYVIKVQV